MFAMKMPVALQQS